MGVKSTTRLTREQAEERYVDLFLEATKDQLRRIARSKVALMDDKQLEDALEFMNDARFEDGEGFDNFLICENPEDD